MCDHSAARVAILGAGHAGGACAALLRQYGHKGPIVLIGDEPIPPYQRPPLSKAWLKGEADAESLALRPLEFYSENDITFHSSTRAVRIHRADKLIDCADGWVIPYDTLVIATGARPIALPIQGANLAGVRFLRTAEDAEGLKASLAPGKTMVVIGGGYVGLEVAASGRSLGVEVVVIEREPRVLARVASEALSDFFTDYHQRKGVRFEVGCSAEAFVGRNGRVEAVVLTDGRTLPCDIAVVGIGAAPNQEIASEAGLDCARGIIVDLEARTSDPDIFAIGDVTQRPLPLYNRNFRLESVPNALEQAKQAAAAITGRAPPRAETPWQWSDQYDLKLQIAGYPFDVDDLVVRGDPQSGRFAVFHLKENLVQAVEALNSPPEFKMGKNLIGGRRPVNKGRLADISIPMTEVAE